MDIELINAGTARSGLLSTLQPLGFEVTDDNLLLSLCTSKRLFALVMPNCTAHFMYSDGSHDSESDYCDSFQGSLDLSKGLRCTATALTVVPLAFLRNGKMQRSSVVLVGFSDGYIRGYSKSGQLILSEQLHTDAVVKFSFMSSESLQNDPQNSIAVLVGTCMVCIIDGTSLVELVQSNVAKMIAGVGWSKSDEDSVHLIYQKWHLKDQISCSDIVLIGHSLPSVYDYLCEATNVMGFDASFKSGPIMEAKLISVGEHPMIALHKITKDAGHVNVSEVVHAVASKVKNAVLGKISQAGGWFGWKGLPEDQHNLSTSRGGVSDDKIQQSSVLPMDSSIPDNRRSILSVVVSPLGNLAILVDSFGRIILLDTTNFVIRRMWKGYRSAQCGWMLVHDKSGESPSKKSQCLCIYAAIRGILEIWPTVYGRRVAAFHVGKGCRLFYSPTRVFSSESSHESIEYVTFVLTPLGNLLKVFVPLPRLLRLNDPVSSDGFLLKRFAKAAQEGNLKDIEHVLSDIKSVKCLKQALDIMLRQHSASLALLVDVIDFMLNQLKYSNSSTLVLHQYLLGCRQLIMMKLALDIYPSGENNKEVQPTFELPEQLRKYYMAFYPSQNMKQLDIYSVIQSFNLPSEIGEGLVSDGSPELFSSNVIKLCLKDDIDPTNLSRLGCTLLMPLLSTKRDISKLRQLFQHSGISKQVLIILLSQIFMDGVITEPDVDTLHSTLYCMFSAILRIDDPEEQRWSGVCRQCALSYNVGHAFSLVLIHQKLCEDIEDSVEGETDEWHTVTAERGHWATLYSNLQLLIPLSNIVGLEALKTLPSVPFADISGDTEHSYTVDLANIKFFDKVYRNSNMCAASIKNGGPCLITHCLCNWIIENNYSPELTCKLLSTDPSIALTKFSNDIYVLQKLFPDILELERIFINCAWQAGFCRNNYRLCLSYLNELSDPQEVSGTFSLLWCLKFENVIMKSIESFKKGMSINPESVELVGVCRKVFGYMLQFSMNSAKKSDNEETPSFKETDECIHFEQSKKRISLRNIAQAFPCLNYAVIHTTLEFFLLFEIVLQYSDLSVSLLSLFPTWFRNSLKKGLYKSSWQTQVPVQLKQKRLKFLLDAVKALLVSKSQPVMMIYPDGKAIGSISSSEASYFDIKEFQDFVFALGELWNLDLDRIRSHWTCNLFSGGMVDNGINVFLAISDKIDVVDHLLSLTGYMTDHLLQSVEDKPAKLVILAQTPPTLLEWMRKQGLSNAVRNSYRMHPSWKTVHQLINFITPYLTGIQEYQAKQLSTLIKLLE